MTDNLFYKTVLSIAGSDSIGGAGIQADIKTCSALKIYAMTAVTAITAQNSTGVHGVEAVSAEFVGRQLEAVVSDVVPDAIKIGMLPNAEVATVVAEFLERHRPANVVVDPVMQSTSGWPLSDDGVKQILLDRIIPAAAIVTTNIPEAESLSGISGDPLACAERLRDTTGVRCVMVKGGHNPVDGHVIDLLLLGDKVFSYKKRFIDTPNTHGTGCALSSAIAAQLARGRGYELAVRRAIGWLHRAIEKGAGIEMFHGHGPVNHCYE